LVNYDKAYIFCRIRPYDESALAKGVAASSLVDGITATENVFNAISARVGLIIGRLEVGSSGYKQRQIGHRMKNCIVHADRSVRCGSKVVQFAYGGDGCDPRFDVKLNLKDLDAAEAEGVDPYAIQVLRRAGREASSVVPIDWLVAGATRAGSSVVPPSSFVAAEDAAVVKAALELGPWEPSTVTRAALLVRLRASERARLGIHGAGLRDLLKAMVEAWDRNRAPEGFAAGIFVGTSVGPPATQGALNAFNTAGMHGGGAESADEAAQACFVNRPRVFSLATQLIARIGRR